jgi:hypothetical protein
MRPDIIIPLILGVLYTVRKLEIRKREPEQFPSVSRADFERWRAQEAGAFSLISVACFAKVLCDYAFMYIAQRAQLEPSFIRIIGGSIFAAWVIGVVLGMVRGSRARKLRESLGIDLSTRPSPS